MTNLDPALGGLLAAGGTILGALGVIVNNRRSGRLTMTEQQLRYINDQQGDIAELRAELTLMQRDFADLWDWAITARQKAAGDNVDLGPLPRRRPRSAVPEQKGSA
jgi:hypothetical protein